MKASIIIAAYNIERYIERCLISAINQSEKDIEIIVVNDGSTDNTLKIIKNIAINDNRINIISKKNAGLIEARKSGLIEAKGEYILFLDGDDWLELNCIEELYKSAKESDYDVILYNAYNAFDNRKEKLYTFNQKYSEKNFDPIKAILLDEIAPTIWSKFIKRKFINTNNIQFPSDISFAEDLATTANIFINNPKMGFNNKCLYNYYQRNDSISRKISNKVIEIDEAIEFIKRKLIEKNLYNTYKKEFEYMVFRHIFISKILRVKEIYPQRRIVYRQYMDRKIKIKNNNYISRDLRYGNKKLKLRMDLYYFSYEIATIFDLLNGFIEKPILSNK